MFISHAAPSFTFIDFNSKKTTYSQLYIESNIQNILKKFDEISVISVGYFFVSFLSFLSIW